MPKAYDDDLKRGRRLRKVSRKSVRKSRKVSRKSVRKSRKVSRKSRKVSRKSLRKSRKVSRKSLRKSRKVSRKSLRKSRKVSRKPRKVSRKSRKVSRKSRKVSPKSVRKFNRRSIISRKSRNSMGKRERTCKDLLKDKVGINMGEFEDDRFVSRKQAIAVAYSQVKKMKPSCSKYFTRK